MHGLKYTLLCWNFRTTHVGSRHWVGIGLLYRPSRARICISCRASPAAAAAAAAEAVSRPTSASAGATLAVPGTHASTSRTPATQAAAAAAALGPDAAAATMAATALAPVEVAATKTATSLVYFWSCLSSIVYCYFVNIKILKCCFSPLSWWCLAVCSLIKSRRRRRICKSIPGNGFCQNPYF